LVGDGPGQLPIGELSPGNDFRPFRKKGDDGGRHRRRRQVNRVFMSLRFHGPDFLDLESHSGCRASGPDGRYFSPPEETPLSVVLHPKRLATSQGAQICGNGRSRGLPAVIAIFLRSYATGFAPIEDFLGNFHPAIHGHGSQMLMLILEFVPGGPRLTCGPTLSTNKMRPWD